MACTYTFEGVTYTEQEFLQYINNNKDLLIQKYNISPVLFQAGDNNTSFQYINKESSLLLKSKYGSKILFDYYDAVEMDSQNISPDYIFEKTGWFKVNIWGKDEWKYELNNTPSFKETFKEEVGVYKLEDIINHEDLFLAFPQLKNLTVEVVDNEEYRRKYGAESKASYIRETDNEAAKIVINKNNPNFKRDIGLYIHEIQHAIDNIENPTTDGSVYFVNNYRRTIIETKIKLKGGLDNLTPSEIDDIIDSTEQELRQTEIWKEFIKNKNNSEILAILAYARSKDKSLLITEALNYAKNQAENYYNNTTNVSSLLNTLIQTGLANKVSLLTTDQINSYLANLGITEEVRKQIEAWHVSNNKFEKFDKDTIGYGFGTLFGRGFYFTDNIETTKQFLNYRKVKIKIGDTIITGPAAVNYVHYLDSGDDIKNHLKNITPDYLKVADEVYGSDYIKDIKLIRSAIEKNEKIDIIDRYLYKTNISEDIIEWDKPISDINAQKLGEDFKNLTGEEVYNKIKNDYSLIENYHIFEFIRDKGVAGVKYPLNLEPDVISNREGFGYVIFDENAITIEEVIQFQNELSEKGVTLTPKGFVHNNEVFINKDTATLDTPIHEFAHLYNRALKQNNPELYQRGIDLVNQELKKENSEIKEVIDYVKTTQPNLQGEALAEEILAELTGRRGIELLEKHGNKKSGIIAWLKEAFEAIKQMLGLSQMSNEQAMNLTLQEFSDAIATDLLSGNSNIGNEINQNNNKVKFQIIGEQGATALDKAEESTHRLDNLGVAREMEAANKSAKEIRLATGWERGADNKWRYEIMDGKPKGQFLRNFENGYSSSFSGKLVDILDSPELFDAYPQLAHVRIDFREGRSNNRGLFNVSENLIEITGNKDEQLSTLIHEIQHAIQHIEGFAKGGNTQMMTTPDREIQNIASPLTFPKLTIEKRQEAKKIAKEKGIRLKQTFYFDVISDDINVLEDSIESLEILNEVSPNETYVKLINALDKKIMNMKGENVAYSKYRKLSGEVEARNVQTRANMSMEERRKTLLLETEDVAREDQIILMDALGTFSQENNSINFQISSEQQSFTTERTFNEEVIRNIPNLTEEQAKATSKLLQTITENAAQRAGVTVEEYLKNRRSIYIEEPLSNERAVQLMNVEFSNYSNEEYTVLNQPNQNLKGLANHPQIVKLGLDINNTEEAWIARYITKTEEGKKLLGSLGKNPTAEQLKAALEEQFKIYGDKIKGGNEFYITEISDEYIDAQIEKSRKESNSENIHMWEDVKRNKQKYINEQQTIQRQNLSSLYDYYNAAIEYPLAMKLMILDSITKYDYRYDKDKDKIGKSQRGNNTIKPHILPNSLFMNKVITHPLSDKNIMHDYFYEALNFKGEKINLQDYKENIHSIEDNGTWYHFTKDRPQDQELFYKMSALSAEYPGAWCTGGSINTAIRYLKDGDLYIFYDNRINNSSIQLHIEGSTAIEIGGLESGQGIRPEDIEVIDKFKKDNPGIDLDEIESYNRYSRLLLKWQNSDKDVQVLSREDLKFLLQAEPYYKDRTGNLEKFRKSLTKKDYAYIYNTTEDNVFNTLTNDNISKLRENSVILGNISFNELELPQGFTIPKGVTFKGAVYFNYLELPQNFIQEGVTFNGNVHFFEVTLPQGFTIPKGVTFNGEFAFRRTTLLQEFTISEGVTFNKNVYFVRTKLPKDFSIQEGVIFNGVVKFDNLILSENFTIPKGVTFKRRVSFVGATLPEGFTIQEGAIFDGYVDFSKATLPKRFTIPKGVTFNGDVSFSWATLSEGFTIQEGVIFNKPVDFNHSLILEGFTILKGAIFNDNVYFLGATLPKEFSIQEGVIFNENVEFENVKIARAKLPEGLSISENTNSFTITYPDGNSVTHKKNQKAGEVLQQDNRGVIVQRGEKSLTIFNKNSDITTIIHEKAHEYENVLTKDEIKTLEEWSGHKHGTTEFSEAFAKGAEKVLYDGAFANEKLDNIFTKFAKWFKQLIEDAIAYFSDINEMNQDVLKIYSNMMTQIDLSIDELTEKRFEEKSSLNNENTVIQNNTNTTTNNNTVNFNSEEGVYRAAVIVNSINKVKLRALEKPNFATLIHEFGHIIEQDLTADEIKILENWSGYKHGTTEYQEMFADGFVKFMSEDHPEVSALNSIFAKIAKWLRTLYDNIFKSNPNLKLNNEVRIVYARLLGVEQQFKERLEKEASLNNQPQEVEVPPVTLYRSDYRLQRVNGSKGNAIYFYDNPESALEHGSNIHSYTVSADKIVAFDTYTAFLREVNAYINQSLPDDKKQKTPPSPEQQQEYLDYIFSQGKVVKLNSGLKNKVEYLVGDPSVLDGNKPPQAEYVRSIEDLIPILERLFGYTNEQAVAMANLLDIYVESEAARQGVSKDVILGQIGFGDNKLFKELKKRKILENKNILFSSEQFATLRTEIEDSKKNNKYNTQSNLPEDVWHLTQTPSFKKWFDKSTVLDANDEAEVQWYWSEIDNIDSFNLTGLGQRVGSLIDAKNTRNNSKQNTKGKFYPLFVKLNNPLPIVDLGNLPINVYANIIKTAMAERGKTISPEDLNTLYTLTNLKGEDIQHLDTILNKYGFDGLSYLNENGETNYIITNINNAKMLSASSFVDVTKEATVSMEDINKCI